MPATVLCFSHLRWRFVFQRPQHLLTRYAQLANVTFFEEPIYEERLDPHIALSLDASGVTVATPLLPSDTPQQEVARIQATLLDQYVLERNIDEFVAWYYTPMALLFSRHLKPALTVFDCMDELSAFQNAPAELHELESELLSKADVVFAGGRSLYEARQGRHSNVHEFPSSIDRSHFSAANTPQQDPLDQSLIPHPRIGFFGVLDERLDRDLLSTLATAHAEWQFVLVGPVVKIRDEDLPRASNIHYLGRKEYGELPMYLANWDVAMLPFALNESTFFISPTKTLEYLAASRPVVSTPIRDVVEPYGRLGLVRIAATADEFGAAIKRSLERPSREWLENVDRFLARTSWEETFDSMMKEMRNSFYMGPKTEVLEPLQKGGITTHV